MRAWTVLASAALLAASLVPVRPAATAGDPGFPHARHEGLFPGCELCHAGVAAGSAGDRYPAPERCAGCHDGSVQPVVSWRGPSRSPSNLAFDHGRHAEELARTSREATCGACHAEPGSPGRMLVGRPTPQRCLACHEPAADTHLGLSGGACAGCHVPLAGAPDLEPAWIATLPRPSTHRAPAFLSEHGEGAGSAQCALCHARESCERCHMNGERLPAVRSLPRDPRVAALVEAKAPEYPRPTSHDDASWSWSHGELVGGDAASCANCHARESCTSCHLGGGTPAIAALPQPPADDRRGVSVERPGRRLHRAGFGRDHGTEAAAGTASCESCHAASTCQSCHTAQAEPAFHAGNFLERHGSDAWGADTRCASCHNNELFCRACHATAGRTPRSGSAAVFHDSQPFWLLGHGRAARQSLEGCTTCHSQAACAQCHSATGGWGVSPHGNGFDPRRAERSNPIVCQRCHLGTP